ncbi:hypothetical protein Tco_0002901 [Tanacetum coccineum]
MLTLEEYMKNTRDEYGWKVVESEVLNFLMIEDDLFTWDTPLGMIFDEFNRLSGIGDDLFTYDMRIPGLSCPSCGERQCGNSENDRGEYIKSICYEECEKIYVEAVIFINKRLVRLIDVTVKQWLDLKYGDHETMDDNIKKEVIATWLIRSYKRQFEDYLEIKKQREMYAREVDMEYNPSNVVFTEWLSSKFYNHLEMDWYTKNALWVYWMRRGDEVAFDESNYLLKVDTDLFTHDIPGFKTYEEFKNEWISEWNKGIPWVLEEPWSENGVPYQVIGHICEPFRFKNGKTKWPTYHEWYYNLEDGKLKDETLEQKAIYEGSWGEATRGTNEQGVIQGKREPKDDQDIGKFQKNEGGNDAPCYAKDEEEQYNE